jgi:hypothetical protein
MKDKKPTYESTAPKTAKSAAREREKLMSRKMEELLALDDRELFKARLKIDFGIGPDHPRFDAMLAVFDAQRR